MRANFKTLQKYEIRVLKTPEGYLKDIEEWKNKDGRNYDFTQDPLHAYHFKEYTDTPDIPKYIELYSKEDIKIEEDICKYLNGEMLTIKVEKTVKWEEIKSTNNSKRDLTLEN